MTNEQYDELKQILKETRQAAGVAEFNQNKKNNEVKERIEKLEGGIVALTKLSVDLSDRIVILEEARKRQIELNKHISISKPISESQLKVGQPASVELSPVARNILHGLIKSIFKRYEPGKQSNTRQKK